MKVLHLIFPALLTALVLSGCVTPVSEVEDIRGTGTLSLSVGVDAPDLQTKAEAGQTFDPLLDGSAFNSLLVALVNNQNNQVVQTKWLTDLPVSGVTSTNVTFAQLPSGDYQIYAFGNDDHTAWLEDQDAMIDLKNITPGNTMPTILLKNDGGLPPIVGSGMILSGRKTITINSQTKNDSVILSRPVVHFKVVLENNTDFPVTLTDLAFNKFNASRSYLVDQRASESAAPSLPTSNTYGGLPSFSAVEPVNPHSKDTVYSCLLLENAAPTEYLIKASMKMNAGTVASPDWHYMDLGKPTPIVMTAAEVRDCDTAIHNVMLLNPQNDYRYGRLIGINSDDEQNVKLINQPKPSSGGTLTDYEQWLHTIVTNPTIKHHFVLTLRKENGQYRLLDRKGYNVFAYLREGKENDEEGLRDEKNARNGYALTYQSQAKKNPNNKFNPSFVNDPPYLMRFFYTYEDMEYYLWCRGFTGSDSREGLWTALSTLYPGSEWQDHHFVFFKVRSNGAPLKRIDDRTGSIDPVTYMPRNTEITAVISVYYNGDGQAEINYEVKNWVEAAEAGWTFGKWEN